MAGWQMKCPHCERSDDDGHAHQVSIIIPILNNLSVYGCLIFLVVGVPPFSKNIKLIELYKLVQYMVPLMLQYTLSPQCGK